MKKGIVILVLAVLGLSANLYGQELVWENISREHVNITAVLVDPLDTSIIYMGASGAILKSEDSGVSWISVLSIRGDSKTVNRLVFDPAQRCDIYAATGNGLFYSNNQGRNWRRIFSGKGNAQNECTALAILPNEIYLGTKSGLFISKDKGRSWRKGIGKIGVSHILALAINFAQPESIFVACIEGVFKVDNSGEPRERIFVAQPTQAEDAPEVEYDDRDEENNTSGIRDLLADKNNLYLATDKGIYKSADKGLSWSALSDYGLLDKDVRLLLISPGSVLYAATKTGVFKYEEPRWLELSSGLAALDIKAINYDNKGNLYVASARGLFKTIINDMKIGPKGLNMVSKDGPDIREIQKVAVSYAEVNPEKIMLWRKQAATKAWLPKISIGLDRNTGDMWHWEGGSTTKSDDDTLRKGRDSLDWDVSLSWDLGELIWNESQTSIDVRSRLMVELRDDILNEVTKLYFERLRTAMELESLGIEDRKKRLEKELRLDELTAMLDGLTGGYFSKYSIDKKINF